MKYTTGKSNQKSGFTLIELLTVIVIMAIVAGMVVGLAGVAGKKKRIARTQAELNQLVTAIDSYFAEYNSYPPQVGGNYAVNSLYHELTGTKFAQDNITPANSTFTTSDGRLTLNVEAVQEFFGLGGFAHVSDDVDPSTSRIIEPKNFIPSITPGQTALIKINDPSFTAYTAQILIVPAEAPPGKGIIDKPTPMVRNYAQDIDGNGKIVNPWRYNASNPSNNPNSYDLWAEIQVGDDTIIIGNWDN